MAKKLYLEYIHLYPKKEIYSLAFGLGRRLINYLGEELFLLLLDSQVLLNYYPREIRCISDETYKIHPAAKALEGFLNKVIRGKKLKMSKGDSIGEVFGKKDEVVRKKIKNKKLIAKTKSVWDFCRNDVMHFSPNRNRYSWRVRKKYEEITEIIVLLFKDFYGKTEPDDEIRECLRKYVLEKSSRKSLLDLIKSKLGRLYLI